MFNCCLMSTVVFPRALSAKVPDIRALAKLVATMHIGEARAVLAIERDDDALGANIDCPGWRLRTE